MKPSYEDTPSDTLRTKADHLRAIILLDSADIQSRRDLLAINAELGRRQKEYVFRATPIMPRL
jgi:hypothetical protein